MFFTMLILAVAFVFLAQQLYEKWKENTALKGELQNEKYRLNAELQKYAPIVDLEKEIANLKESKGALVAEVGDLRSLSAEYELKIDLEEMGFYQPKFRFDDVLQYEEALDLVREAQKELVRQKKVIEDLNGRTVNKPSDIGKLAVGAFNGDAANIVESVSVANFEKSKEKVLSTFNKINGLLSDQGLAISKTLLELKIKELALVYDFKEQERKAKEEQAAIKEMMREEEDARTEAEEIRIEAAKEKERFQAALDLARKELEGKTAEERAKHEAEVIELQKKLEEATAKEDRATSMAQITREGHVYIISNIGSFGENVLKIGLTRRTDPMERVRELGDAAVPFQFDVHAMIPAKDAPSLENALHKKFDLKRLNKVNHRKEFFRVTLDEIAHACEELGHQPKITKVAEAAEYKATKDIEKTPGNKAA